LFQALEKRTLTEEEQSVIYQRVRLRISLLYLSFRPAPPRSATTSPLCPPSPPQVALQRKMFEEYERRESKRKVAELLEVCPDITVEEAEAALRLSDGREDEAAASLVSNPAFLRKVKAACGTGPPPPPPASTRQTRQGEISRPVGPRPKRVDPASLGDAVFCGSFRGKGFTGGPKGAKPNGGAGASKAAAAASEPEAEEEEEEEAPQEVQEAQEPADAAPSGRKRGRRASKGADLPPQQQQQQQQQRGTPAKAAASAGASPPPTVPKAYQLVMETSDGRMRPATDSEIRDAARYDADDGECQQGATPGRRSRRVAAAAAAAEDSRALSPSVVASMAKRLASLDDASALAWLAKMEGATTAAALEELGTEDPERAVALREALDTGAAAPAPATATAAHAARAAEPAAKEEAGHVRRSPRRGSLAAAMAAAAPAAAAAAQAAEDSEATVSEGGEGASDDDDFVARKPGRGRKVRRGSGLGFRDRRGQQAAGGWWLAPSPNRAPGMLLACGGHLFSDGAPPDVRAGPGAPRSAGAARRQGQGGSRGGGGCGNGGGRRGRGRRQRRRPLRHQAGRQARRRQEEANL
jgi:hypothetical protein